MEETQISITIKPIYLERLLYWIVILVLVVLLAIAWSKEGKTPSATVKDDSANNAPASAINNTPSGQGAGATPEPPKASCTDGTLNQDETATDCGGSLCPKCASGQSCKAASDCIGGYCVSGKCTSTAPTTAANASGKVDFSITNIVKQASGGNTTPHYKVTGISYKITNGLGEDLTGLQATVYVKDKVNRYCLNQISVDGATNCEKEYALFTIENVASGKSVTGTATISGSYVAAWVGNSYDPTDSTKNMFNVVVYIKDKSGNDINGKVLSDSYLVKP